MAQPFGAFEPKFEQEAIVHWWSPTDSRGRTFERPAGVANCATLKGGFQGDLQFIQRRVGGPILASGRFLVEDNLGHANFAPGSSFDVGFFSEYYGEPFYDWRVAPHALVTRSRDDPDTLLSILASDLQPPPVVYVCAFRQRDIFMLAYFLSTSPRRPYSR